MDSKNVNMANDYEDDDGILPSVLVHCLSDKSL